MQNWNGNDAINTRVEFQNAKAALMAPGVGLTQMDIENAMLTQSYLRFEQLLTATSNVFNFPILTNDGAVRVTERRLKLQDAFYVSGIKISLCQAASATATNMALNSYPSPVTFATPSGLPAALYTFYNGYYTITVNNIVIVPAYPLMDFLEIPQTQLTGATNTPIDQFSGSNRMALQPNPVFIGQKDSKFAITMPSNLSIVPANVYIVVEAFGILAQNVTVVS